MFEVASIAVLVAIPLALYRAIRGPLVYDRVLAANVIGTKTVVILALIGMIYGRIDMFVDISLAYALLNFIGTLAAAKYLEHKEAMK